MNQTQLATPFLTSGRATRPAPYGLPNPGTRRRSVRDLPKTIAGLGERLSKLTADESTATAHAHDRIVIGKQPWNRDDAPVILAKKLELLLTAVRETTRVPLGIFHGLQFGLVLHPQFPPDVYLEGATIRHVSLSREHQGPRAVLNALERIAIGYAAENVRTRQDLSIAESQLRDYQARLGRAFPHDTYLSQLTALRDQLKARLSASAHDSSDGKAPTVSELADSIKSLKAANTIEAGPQRVERKVTSAEEPITARIRRRQEANIESNHTAEQNLSPEPSALPSPSVGEDSFSGQPKTFQERIAMERQRKDHVPSLT